jgi:hypothetical protein
MISCFLSQQPHWAWFMVWAEYIQNQNSQDAVKHVYDSGNVYNRGYFSLGPLPPAPANLALGKVIKAGSTDDSSRGPEKAVDGDMGTRWSSAYSDQQ